jgi:hypothetical protein
MNNNKMKRGFVLTGVFLFIALFLISNVSASPFEGIAEGLGNLIKGIIEILSPVLKIILGNVAGKGLFFTKVLLFIIVLSIVWIALEQIEVFKDYEFIHWTLTIVVSILSVRFLTEESWIQTILLPYSTLGVAITAFLPFIIWFLFVTIGLKDQPPIIRKFLWIAFAVVFLSLWSIRQGEFTDITTGFNASNIYIWVFILSLAMVFFDGTIQKFLNKAKIDRLTQNANKRLIDQLMIDMQNIQSRLTSGNMSSGAFKTRMKQIKEQIIALGGKV